MKARRLPILLSLPLLATGVAACGTTATSTSNFKGEQQKVAQAVADLQSDATALEAKKICSEVLAAARVAQLNRAGGCKQAIESQLKQIDSFEVTVGSVQISGHTALAHVKSVYSGKKAITTLTLVKEGSHWKISGLS
jgi:hypothetical protein